MSSIALRLAAVQDRITQAALASGRDPKSVRLIAVSKLMPSEALREAYAAGQRDFGENYVQELAQKAKDLLDLPDLRLHLIGHLQTNKVKVVANAVSMIQSVDSVRLVEELGKRVPVPAVSPEKAFVLGLHDEQTAPSVTAPSGAQTALSLDRRLPLLVEVNVGGEAQKSGCNPAEVPAIVDAIERYAQLRVAGLMTVPPFSEDPKAARPHFDRLRALRDELGGPSRLPELSMGMTLDLEEAVAAGATIVRVGTAIFGSRPPREAK
jgi:uncharacterized pyridoxal phosphate-containing UPF0001 family protein